MSKTTVGLFLCVGVPGFGQKIATTFSFPVKPIENYQLLSGNDFLESDPARGYHTGEDWNSWDGQDYGDSIYAIADGQVVTIRDVSDTDSWGKVVVIRHRLLNSEEIFSVYAHLSQITVRLGQEVFPGKRIGAIGDANGYYSGAHLHFEIRTNEWSLSGNNPYLPALASLQTVAKYLHPVQFIADHDGPGVVNDSREAYNSRARQDLVRLTAEEGHFTYIRLDLSAEAVWSDPNFQLYRTVVLNQIGATITAAEAWFHATDYNDPTNRWVLVYDYATRTWGGWEPL